MPHCTGWTAAGVTIGPAGTTATRTRCENCHSEQDEYQDSQVYPAVAECIGCHVPCVTKSAIGNTEMFTGDIRTHLMDIDPQQIGQFTKDDSEALSQVGLDSACRHCRVHGGSTTPKTGEERSERQSSIASDCEGTCGAAGDSAQAEVAAGG